MEEFNASAGTAVGPEDRATSAPASGALDAGRLGGVLLQLHSERFDGILNISCGATTAAIGFRQGTPVTFDDPTPGHTLADQFVERGQLTREQCNTLLARMTDALVDDEAIAFCEHAVQLGFLTEDEANVELSSRIRARLLQLFSLRECEASLIPGIAALLDRREFPQDVGALLYMGVRTFYEEELLHSCHPDLSRTFVRLSAPPATIVQFFGLDDEELHLLRRIQPDDPASLLVETRKVERVHLLALLLLLRMTQFCEVFNHPQARATTPRMPHARPPHEPPMQARGDASSARHAPGPAELPRERSDNARTAPAPAPEQGPVTRTTPAREEGSVARRAPAPPAYAREEGSVARRAPIPPAYAREEGSVARRAPAPPAHTREERPFARTTGPRVPEASLFANTSDVPPEPPPREERSAPHKAPAHAAPEPSARPPMAARPAATDALPDPPAPGPSARPTVDATQEALLEAAARTARMRRSLPARRNAKPPEATAGAGNPASKAPETTVANSTTPSKHPPAEPRPDYAKAHLRELIARRKHAAGAAESGEAAARRDHARELREARSLLHAQHYTRAEKLLSGLVESDPANALFKTYWLWARWRAQPEAAESVLGELQELAKKLVSDAEHGGFAVYALGHVYFHSKRDDLAEKFFKRAHAIDRGNKDAERHLMILERRKHAAADGGAGGNRKLFGIQLPNKPKP